MKICLVSAFPPSRRGLNEYGFHVARELQQNSLLDLTILADELEEDAPEYEDFEVIRCWSFGKLSNPFKLLRTVRALKPDVVWYNLLFSTFGNRPLPAFAGLTSPLLTRLSGVYTHITLHHLIDNVNLADAGVRYPRLYRTAGEFATRMLLMANSISVLLPAYRRTLVEKYHGEDVHFRAHGVLSARPEPPQFELRNGPEHRVLAFGKWGTYKRLETVITAFSELHKYDPQARLIIAGGDHPKTPGYVQSVADQHQGNPYIRFTGYVPEADIQELFKTATVLVMPYSSATGASGVAHLACEFGLPIVSADIRDFREMADDERLAIKFYKTDDAHSLAETMLELLQNPALQRAMGEQNFSAALRMTMPQIVRQYLRSFELNQRRRALEPIARFRRIPTWVPSRSALFRAAAPGWAAWM